MTLRLTVATDEWRSSQERVQEQVPGLVPVAKGNGYGFGMDVLAREATRMGAGVIAVGTAHEVSTVRLAGWPGEVVVLNPWRPGDELATSLLGDPKIISTVSRVQDANLLVREYPEARVLLELDTSMHRHGMHPAELDQLVLGDLGVEGWSIHLPANGSLEEATMLAEAASAHHDGAVWVSHLSIEDYTELGNRIEAETRMRIGTRLWLGAPDALSTTATVLDVHPIKRGGSLGYHQVRVPRDGWIVIVSGGTAHGVALAAPVPQRSLKQRLTTIVDGVMRATTQTLSPFTIKGRKRNFAEPPHMHSSMVFVPGRTPGVEVGNQVPVTCRMTTTRFDEVVWL